MSAKLKETYRKTYKRGAAQVRKELLPASFPFTTKGWVVDEIEMMAAGALADGREFQEIRIVTRKLTSVAKPFLRIPPCLIQLVELLVRFEQNRGEP